MLEKLNFESKRKALIKKWNTEVLCRMPSKKRLDAYKKNRQIERRELRRFAEEEMKNVEVVLQQEEEIRKYLTVPEGDGLGKTFGE